jgi:hypothetical protein
MRGAYLVNAESGENFMDDRVTDRLKMVLKQVYDGDMLSMANAMSVARTTCQRYISGEISIPKRSRVALSQSAKIRLEWLERGIGGEPIQYNELSSTNSLEEFGLPVFSAPLETAPTESSPGRLGMKLLAPPPYFGVNRYWVKVSRENKGTSILTGDYILVDPCPSRVVDPVDDVNRLRVVRRDQKQQFHLVTADKRQNDSIRVCGLPILLHRDLQG